MEYNFDAIRAYNSEEIPPAMERLCNEKPFMKVLSTLFPLMPKDQLRQKLLGFKSSYDLQSQMVVPFLQYIEATLTTGIELKGLENIDTKKTHLYVSNHRDIILDSAFLNGKFLLSGLETTEIAIGNNLLALPWIEDLVRANKSFLVQRGLTPHEMLESSRRLSAYIRYTLTEKGHSVWIAQREGRAKDSDDRTQESLLKMFSMSGDGSLTDSLKDLNICPLSISYEYDPCDFLKAKEFQQKRDNPEFKKSPKDDLISMQTGVMGYKGKVTYIIAGGINNELTEIASKTKVKNEQAELVAKLIDQKIHSHFNIFASNKIAYDLLNGEQRFASEYSSDEKNKFEEYIDKQIRKIDLENKDRDYLRLKILEMYANPLKNYLEAKIN